MKKAYRGHVLGIAIGIAVLVLLLAGTAGAKTLAVNASGSANYIRIQDAINASNNGDTILVESGTYYENVNVNKQLILKGIDTSGSKPIVDGRRSGNTITLSAGNTTLEGFSVANSGTMEPDAGVYVVSNNNQLKDNIASKNHNGIYISFSSNSTLSGNNASNNDNGIYLRSSNHNIITNNMMNNNKYNFRLDGNSYLDFDHQIDTSNQVDGKPIYYIKAAINTVYDSSTNAGIFYCISCINVTIKDLNFNKNYVGVFFWNTTLSNIQNVKASNNYNGIYLYESSNNTLGGNNAILNNYNYGIILDYSSNSNTLNNNNVNSNYNYGIYLHYSSNNTLRNNSASNNLNGNIYLGYSSNNTLSDNNASNSSYGIYLYPFSNYNTLNNNNALNNYNGIYLFVSSNNMLSNNNASNNYESGISLVSSSNNTLSDNNASNNNNGIYLSSSSHYMLTNNMMNNNKYNFRLDGNSYLDFDHQIDTSNQVDGKPIYYIKAATNTVYDSSTNAGIFYCISCMNVTIKDLNFNKNYVGVFFWNTTLSSIQNVNASSNFIGIYLDSSSNNTMSNNNASSNFIGIYLWSSSNNNTLRDNNASNNNYGISLYYSGNSTLSGNNASNNNNYGINLWHSSNNTFSGNNASNNQEGGIFLIGSSNNTLSGNNASNNNYGISLGDYYSNNNVLSNNNASNNNYGIYLGDSSNNVLSNNNASNNNYGISLLYSSNNNTIYNNLFNNINNVAIVYSVNRWNITKTNGTNIINGSYLGGNVWANPNGTDFSQTCSDSDKDGICDSPYTLDGNNTDYLPLAYKTVIVSPTDTAPAITGITAVNISDTSADITFTVNQSDARTIVYYGTTESLGGFSNWNNYTGLSRTIALSNLNESTKYYYSIYAYNGSNQSHFSNSSIQSFTTKSLQPTILSFAPESQVIDIIGAARTFNIKVNQIVNFTWYINGTEVFNQTDINQSSYTNTSAALGTWNVTAIAQNANGTAMQIWDWTVTAPSITRVPVIMSWGNNKTNDASLNITANVSETIRFNATANQSIEIWNWFLNNINQSTNFDNFSYHFAAPGNYIIKVNASNANGTSDTVTWNVNVTGVTPPTWTPNIIDFSPHTTKVTNNVGESRTFSITANQTVNVSWLINGALVQTNTSVTQANYTNTSAALGVWNVTAKAFNANGTTMQTWDWNVTTVTPAVSFVADKNVYIQGEMVTFTFINNGTITVDLPSSAPWWVENAKTGEKVFSPIALAVITPIEPGQSISWTWDQKDNEEKQVPPGMYRGILGSSVGNSSTQDFEILPAQTINGTISGYKINDINGNRKWDAGEKGISNWTIRLIGIIGTGKDIKVIRKEIFTDAMGFYRFDNLPAGKYLVSEKHMKGMKGFVPTGSPVVSIKLAHDENSMNNNFTNKP